MCGIFVVECFLQLGQVFMFVLVRAVISHWRRRVSAPAEYQVCLSQQCQASAACWHPCTGMEDWHPAKAGNDNPGIIPCVCVSSWQDFFVNISGAHAYHRPRVHNSKSAAVQTARSMSPPVIYCSEAIARALTNASLQRQAANPNSSSSAYTLGHQEGDVANM